MKWTYLAVAALATSAGIGTAAARASSDEPEAARPRRDRTVRIERHGGGGYLGVSLDDGQDRGAEIKEVVDDSPAAKAGLKAGDVVVGFDGETVRSAAQLSRLVHETPKGRTVEVAFVRGGSRQQAQVTLGEPRRVGVFGPGDIHIEGLDRLRDQLGDLAVPEPPEPPDVPAPPDAPRPPRLPMLNDMFSLRPRLGVQVVDLGEQLARYFKVDDGVLVSSVNPGSPAEKAGLRAGDIILKVDGQAVGSSRDLVRNVGRTDSAREVTLQVQRDGHPLDVRVRLEPRRPRTLIRPTT
jgi:serine protease Do